MAEAGTKTQVGSVAPTVAPIAVLGSIGQHIRLTHPSSGLPAGQSRTLQCMTSMALGSLFVLPGRRLSIGLFPRGPMHSGAPDRSGRGRGSCSRLRILKQPFLHPEQ